MKPGGQIAVTRAVARLAVQIAQAEEREVSVVIERALRAYAQASPEWQAQQRRAAVDALPPEPQHMVLKALSTG